VFNVIQDEDMEDTQSCWPRLKLIYIH